MNSPRRRHPMPILTIPIAALLALPPAGAQEPQERVRSDATIEDAVVDELGFDHAVPAHRIDVGAVNGIVTLTGTSDHLLARERAAAIARTVKGVRAVVNRLAIAPPQDITARQLRKDLENALFLDPATDAYEVSVEADGQGRVTLSGRVESWAERELCARVAKSVRGVTAIDNRIEVQYRAERPDAEICSEVQGRLRWHVLVDDGLIDVACTDGVVGLSGTVGSAAERVRAIRQAWVAGVQDVDARRLEVARWARDDDLRASKYAVRADADIREAIQDALLQDPRVASFAIDTEVQQGTVTLRGTVDNLRAKRAAANDARNTVGVISVRNRIRVEPAGRRSPASIERDVREALLRDPYVDRFDITVSVGNGTARLYGTVDTSFERSQADDVAAGVRGVVEVRNYIDVRDGGPVPFDPYVDPWPLQTQGRDPDPWYTDPLVTSGSDAAIRRAIREQLRLSPFVPADDVAVHVEDGEAVLTGTVASQAERLCAIENAYDGGARWVVDRLEIRSGADEPGDGGADGAGPRGRER